MCLLGWLYAGICVSREWKKKRLDYHGEVFCIVVFGQVGGNPSRKRLEFYLFTLSLCISCLVGMCFRPLFTTLMVKEAESRCFTTLYCS